MTAHDPLQATVSRSATRYMARCATTTTVCAVGLAALLWGLGPVSAEERVEPSSDAGAADTDTIYTYVNGEGRVVFVNGLSRVPSERRQQAEPVDLSDVSLNEALAADLEEAVDEELGSLLSSDYCVGLRDAASRGWWGTLWREHGHLVALGGGLLLFLLASPYLIRAIGVPRWTKLLLMLLPALAVMGVLSTAAVKTSRAISAVRSAVTPCQQAHYQAPQTSMATQSQRIHQIFDLKARIADAQKHHASQLEAVTAP